MSDGSNDIEECCRECAYLLWETEGKQEGMAQVYWERARELIEAGAEPSYPPAQSQGHRP